MGFYKTYHLKTRGLLGLFAFLLTTGAGASIYDYSYTTNNGTITIDGYYGSDYDLTITNTIGGFPVTGLAFGTFGGNLNLNSITVPSSITNIEHGAFLGCFALSSIAVDTNNPSYSSTNGVIFTKNKTTLLEYPAGKTGGYAIPGSVTNIETYAFCYCTMTNFTIPGSVTTIGDFAFTASMLSGQTNITIPSSVN